MDDLFASQMNDRLEKEQPLAARLRPRTLEEFVGQEHIIAPGRLLYRAIKADQLSSIVLYGPPGTGKTTLARVIAGATRADFLTINAVLSGVKEIRAAIAQAKDRRQFQDQRTILFVDEVHRWNKAQQDALLPWVENGTILLIGATTENPFFEVNRALVSRSRVFQLLTLEKEDLRKIAMQALEDTERGYGAFQVDLHADALDHLIEVADGDARSLLNALELAVETTPEVFPPPRDQVIHITRQVAEESIQRRAVLYDKEGDYHFDTISAFIKSLRGSDPDAALYWMARMVYAGEDPRFIFRRMLIFASEDVGLADPNALVVVAAAADAFDRVGLPEGRFHLSQAALYLSTAPKSNSTMAFFDALAAVEQEGGGEVPNHLRDANRDAKGFGHGEGYAYPHAYRDHWVAQQYLPDELKGRVFYEPGELGFEGEIKEEVSARRQIQLEAYRELYDPSPEVLTFSPIDTARERWLARADAGVSAFQEDIRAGLLGQLEIPRHSVIIDLSAGSPFLTAELARRVPEGSVYSFDGTVTGDGVIVLDGDPGDLDALLETRGEGSLRFDFVVGRNALTSRGEIVLKNVCGRLRKPARVAFVENLPVRGQRLSALVHLESKGLLTHWRDAEEDIYKAAGLSEDAIRRVLSDLGVQAVQCQVQSYRSERRIRDTDIRRWFDQENARSYGSQLKDRLQSDTVDSIERAVTEKLQGRTIPWKQELAFAWGLLKD